ncbi:MAG: DUF167 domain-containing protein [Gemmatimonadales bacterium]
MATLAVYLQPRASRTEVIGRHGDAIKIRVAAPPVGGAANKELTSFLSKILKVPKTRIVISRGQSGRLKMIAVEGLTDTELTRRLGVS